jgi:hypothetical protein
VAFQRPQQLIGRSCHPSYYRGRQTLEHLLRRPILPIDLTTDSIIWSNSCWVEAFAGTFAKKLQTKPKATRFADYFLSWFRDSPSDSFNRHLESPLIRPFLA